MEADLLITARWVLPVTSPPIARGAVLVRGGRIAACGPEEAVAGQMLPPERSPGCRRLELGEAALLPGLVNVHTHLELTCLRGYLEEGEFPAWIRKLTATKYERLDRAELLASARWGVVEALEAGITTVGEACDFGVAHQALAEGGLRGVVYQEVFGPDPRDSAARLEELREKLVTRAASPAPRLGLGVSPHAPYTVSAPLFRAVAELAAEEGLPISIHAAESRAERDLLRSGSGPFAEGLRARGIPWRPPGKSAVAYLDDLGVLGKRTLLVHCADCSEDDIARLQAAGAAVAHCPKSNAKLGHGAAPLPELLAAGLRVGLGTDGVASNNACDLLEEARCGELLQRARRPGAAGREPRDLLRLMTLGGAEALGLSEHIGSLEPGKLADLTAVDLSAPHLQPLHDVEAALLWSASGRDVLLTAVEGEILYERGRGLRRGLDEEALREEMAQVARKLA